jgi:integrase
MPVDPTVTRTLQATGPGDAHFGEKFLRRIVDLYVVKELLGHSSIEMTERYAHLAPSARKEAVARLDE